MVLVRVYEDSLISQVDFKNNLTLFICTFINIAYTYNKMKRKDFILKGMLTSLSTSFISKNLMAKSLDEVELSKSIGHNHIPNNESKTMNTVLHKSETRGSADHGWLKAKHTFSFANYRNPERMNFGVLRVLNDDIIQGGKGFQSHPHDNMEIITIPLAGSIYHKDNMGNEGEISSGDIQVMSAGTGVYHSEFNANNTKDLKLLQIWLFTNRRDANPRYQQMPIRNISVKNEFYQVLSPNESDQGVWIYQKAWFHIGSFDKDISKTYEIKDPKNGLYAFIIDGDAEIEGQKLYTRDGFGIWDKNEISIEAKANSKILLMDVPMSV